MFDDQETPLGCPPYGTGNIDLREGACWIRNGSVAGPIIGKAFLELPDHVTATYPLLPSGPLRGVTGDTTS